MDLPCSIPFYRWLLCEEQSLGLADLAFVAPEVQATLSRLHVLVKKRDRLQQDGSLDAAQKTEQVRLQVVVIHVHRRVILISGVCHTDRSA